MRTALAALTLAMLAGPMAGASRAAVSDELVMRGQKPGEAGLGIFGRIREVKDDKVWIIISDGASEGPISVPMKRVLKIRYDLDGRRAELPAGDHLARYNFALWELSLGCKDEARFDLEAVVGQPGVPAEALLLLAKLQEETGDIRRALSGYLAYLQAKPTDADRVKEAREAVKRLRPLVAALPPEQEPPVNPGDEPKPPDQPDPKPPDPAPKSTVDEGLEVDPRGWRAVPWADPCTVTLMTDDETGNRFLAVQMSGEGKAAGRKTAIQLRVGVAKPAQLTSSKMTFYVYNPVNQPLPISVAFTTGKAGTYVESRTTMLPGRPGWRTVTIDLNASDFKSAETDWAYKTAIKDKDDLKGVTILINARRKMTVYLDYIKFSN